MVDELTEEEFEQLERLDKSGNKILQFKCPSCGKTSLVTKGDEVKCCRDWQIKSGFAVAKGKYGIGQVTL